MKTWIKNMSIRKAVVKMLHIGLNDSWRLMDVIYVLTGRVV